MAQVAQLAGWPTPQAGTPAQNGYNAAGNTDSGRRTVALVPGHVAPSEAAKYAGWPSPTAKDCDSSGTSASNQGNTLTDAARMAGWAIPQTHDAIGPKTMEQIEAMRLRGREKGHEPGVSNLNEQALLVAGWATPSTGDWRTPPHSTRSERDGSPAGERLEAQAAHVIPGASLNGLPAATESRGLLNPRFSGWLQGIPLTWDTCAPPPTPRAKRAG
jgi:hypothetical protein